MRLLLVTLALVSLVGPVSASALQAQRLSELGSDWTFKVQSALSEPAPRLLVLSRAKVSDYRFEGTVVGALVLGAFGGWLGSESCNNQPTPVASGAGSGCTGATLTVGFAGAVLGGGIGYLFGRGIPKYRAVRGEP